MEGEHGNREQFEQIWNAIHDLQENQMSSQADVDALTTAVDQVATDLAAAKTSLAASSAALQTT